MNFPTSKRAWVRNLSVAMVGIIGAFLFADWLTGRLRMAEQKANSYKCGNSLISACYAGKMWAYDNGGYFPTNVVMFTNDIPPIALICPLKHDAFRSRGSRGWSEFNLSEADFEIVSTGLKGDEPNGVFLRCKIHGHLAYTDGTVFDGSKRRRKNERP